MAKGAPTAGTFTAPRTRGGRKKGVPNRATAEAREAIARFVDKNSGRLQEWLDKVAEKDPDRAFTLFQSVIEYHVPKLARQEITGKDGGAINLVLNGSDVRG